SGLETYCSMLSLMDHPGVLIVTRMKSQADTIAENINKLAVANGINETVALAYHGDVKLPVSTLCFSPVLIVTHAAYEIGMDAVNHGREDASNWHNFHTWGSTGRKLVVIDEALDIIEEAQVDLEKVRALKAVIPFEIEMQFPEQMAVIRTIEETLMKMAWMSKQARRPVQERILWRNDYTVTFPDSADLTPLRQALRG